MPPGEDEQDHDQILMDAVFETVDEIAKVYGDRRPICDLRFSTHFGFAKRGRSIF